MSNGTTNSLAPRLQPRYVSYDMNRWMQTDLWTCVARVYQVVPILWFRFTVSPSMTNMPTFPTNSSSYTHIFCKYPWTRFHRLLGIYAVGSLLWRGIGFSPDRVKTTNASWRGRRRRISPIVMVLVGRSRRSGMSCSDGSRSSKYTDFSQVFLYH